MLTKLKKKVQQMLAAEAHVAHKIGLTPNMLSLTGLALSLLSAVAYAMAREDQLLWLLWATILLLVSGFCDTLDGILARTYEKASAFGSFFDSLLDRYADAAVYAGIIASGLCNLLLAMLALTGSLLVSYSRARAETAGIKLESIGVAERAERIIILAAASIVAIFWSQALNVGIALLAILSNLTVLQRGVYVYRVLKKKEMTED